MSGDYLRSIICGLLNRKATDRHRSSRYEERERHGHGDRDRDRDRGGENTGHVEKLAADDSMVVWYVVSLL